MEVYLISNRSIDKWDFGRLNKAICDALPSLQRESVLLTLKATSTEMIRGKVEILRGRIWQNAILSAGVALIPILGLSISADITLMISEISFYRTQLGIPEGGTIAFSLLKTSIQQYIRETCNHLTTIKGVEGLLKQYAAEYVLESMSRFIAIVDPVLAGSLSFACTYGCLDHCLETMEKTEYLVINEASKDPKTD